MPDRVSKVRRVQADEAAWRAGSGSGLILESRCAHGRSPCPSLAPRHLVVVLPRRGLGLVEAPLPSSAGPPRVVLDARPHSPAPSARRVVGAGARAECLCPLAQRPAWRPWTGVATTGAPGAGPGGCQAAAFRALHPPESLPRGPGRRSAGLGLVDSSGPRGTDRAARGQSGPGPGPLSPVRVFGPHRSGRRHRPALAAGPGGAWRAGPAAAPRGGLGGEPDPVAGPRRTGPCPQAAMAGGSLHVPWVPGTAGCHSGV